MSGPSLEWYWHRLRAMSAGEIALRLRKTFREQCDARIEHDWSGVPLESTGAFPKIPEPAAAPAELRVALRRDADAILAGHWRAFGHLELKVDDPPRWHCDYLVGKDFTTTASAFSLDHRALPGGADIKLIWELSRWHALTRLAMAAHVLGDEKAGEKCVLWLEDWVKHNPPFRGWNWTSALEAGLRLINFAWMDALLAPHTERWGCDAELDRLCHEILPPHAWFAWRHQSFGSSANNHLIGELAGLIVATARWPALAQWGAPLAELQRRWEREVLAQFHEDGGNKEQALNYHLFSWELCWHARAALATAGRAIAPAVDERLRRAAQFYLDVQVPSDPWDYGDSDNAFVVPLFTDERRAVQEWHAWMEQSERSTALEFWWGAGSRGGGMPSDSPDSRAQGWREYRQSGYEVWRLNEMTMRLDLSPLGYLKPAAHGHLDVQHLSIWRRGIALVVDAGTGCYFANKEMRTWFASREAHNGAAPSPEWLPRRLGVFLWSKQHDVADFCDHRPKTPSECKVECDWVSSFNDLKNRMFREGCLFRNVTTIQHEEILVSDSARAGSEFDKDIHFTVRWQFASGAKLECLGERRYRVRRLGVAMEIEVSEDWAEVFPVIERHCSAFASAATSEVEHEFAGIVSPSFRKTEWAPFIKLVARPGEKPCVFTTTFLATELT